MKWYFIAGYLLTGIIFNFIGPAAKILNETYRKINNFTIEDVIRYEKIPSDLTRIGFIIVIRSIVLLFWPVIYFIVYPYDYLFGSDAKFRKARKKEKFMSQDEKNDGLFFTGMGGAGHITCNSCGYHQQLVGFIHSFPMDKWNKSGFQCQKCGKFHGIENSHDYKYPIKCDCGGLLSRDEKLFCPKCRSTDLKYMMKFIT